MTTEEKNKRLTEISRELFELANSFGGNETGAIAGNLHQSVNYIWKAQKMINEGITPADEDELMREWLSKQPIYSNPALRMEMLEYQGKNND